MLDWIIQNCISDSNIFHELLFTFGWFLYKTTLNLILVYLKMTKPSNIIYTLDSTPPGVGGDDRAPFFQTVLANARKRLKFLQNLNRKTQYNKKSVFQEKIIIKKKTNLIILLTNSYPLTTGITIQSTFIQCYSNVCDTCIVNEWCSYYFIVLTKTKTTNYLTKARWNMFQPWRTLYSFHQTTILRKSHVTAVVLVAIYLISQEWGMQTYLSMFRTFVRWNMHVYTKLYSVRVS